jgi:enamine deaminase RidA (YjgF/YER057c/UK114 family)
MSIVEQRLADSGHPLPHAPAPVASYVPVIRTGSLVITSGQLPVVGKEVVFTGKLGREIHEEDGQHAARLCALNALAQIKTLIGNLDDVIRIIRVEGYVQSADGFTRQPQVVNGASELLVEAFGEGGKHSRIAVGVAELPLNAAVELAVWAEVATA